MAIFYPGDHDLNKLCLTLPKDASYQVIAVQQISLKVKICLKTVFSVYSYLKILPRLCRTLIIGTNLNLHY